jgi:hypothetical protein
MCTSAASQDVLWTVSTPGAFLHAVMARWFGDYNQDGYADLLVSGIDFAHPQMIRRMKVLSGRDGVELQTTGFVQDPATEMKCVGDWDGDGHPDWAMAWGYPGHFYWEVWSMRTQQLLFQLDQPTPCAGATRCLAGGLDCDGDGLGDLVIGNCSGDLEARLHSGALLWRIQGASLGLFVVDVESVGDIDSDGCDDVVVGGLEGISGVDRGFAALVSGRTGTVRHFHFGPQPYDILNSDVTPAGDIDGDGVTDYAVGNDGGFSGLVMTWSGATGALLREYRNPVGLLTGLFLAGRDVDLDGRPDIIDLSPGYPNVPGQSQMNGRLRTLSSRDGQDLVHVRNPYPTVRFGDSYADLGVQPGNPYPVVAVKDELVVPGIGIWTRLRAIRLSPAGTAVVGRGCSSGPVEPTIGVRRVGLAMPSAQDPSRIVLGAAPPAALAVCAVGAAGQSTHFGVPLPIGLDAIGLPGCQLLVPGSMTAVRVTGSTGMDRGYAEVSIGSALTSSGGTAYAAQWIVLDPTTLEYAVTPRYEFRGQ